MKFNDNKATIEIFSKNFPRTFIPEIAWIESLLEKNLFLVFSHVDWSQIGVYCIPVWYRPGGNSVILVARLGMGCEIKNLTVSFWNSKVGSIEVPSNERLCKNCTIIQKDLNDEGVDVTLNATVTLILLTQCNAL